MQTQPATKTSAIANTADAEESLKGAQISFSSELRAWLIHNLDRGCQLQAIVDSMVAQRFDKAIAQALVQTFIQARSQGLEPPRDSVVLPVAPLEALGEYRYEPSRLAAGSRLHCAGREVRVSLRLAQPMVAVLEGVLSPRECSQLIELARPRLAPSTVVDPVTGLDVVADYRDSHGMFFRLEETAFIAALDRRFSEIMGLPVEQGEGLQVLRYGVGGKSEPHHDYLTPSGPAVLESLARSGQRVSSLVVYLNEVEGGGETSFPAIGLSVSAHVGNAVYFEYANSLRQVDANTLHAGAKVTQGEKWVVTKWMRERRFIPAG